MILLDKYTYKSYVVDVWLNDDLLAWSMVSAASLWAARNNKLKMKIPTCIIK